jgi:hypothetical protein
MSLTSILSYPERGHWGRSNWRGNCSGYIYRDLFQALQPKVFVDPMVGSGTSVEVAREMNIEAYGLDLHSGFNVLRQSVLAAVGKPSDVCIAHPPYHDMVIYSGDVWGDTPHPDDLSRCRDEDEFLEKLQLAMLNMRDAVRPGGYFGIVIGDQRKKGKYVSYQAECIARMPRNELKAVLIKAQHNVQSNAKNYGQIGLPRIMHEYILLWQRPESQCLQSLFAALSGIAHESQRRLRGTWKSIVQQVLVTLGGRANTQDILAAVLATADEQKLAANNNLQDKIRQTLGMHPDTFAGGDGVWELAKAA